jgi:hypothetical protein
MGKKVFTNIVWMLTTGVYCALGAAVYFLWSPCCSFFKYFFVLSYHVSVTFWVQCCDVDSDFVIKTMFCLYPQLFMGWLRSYLRYMCLFAHSGIHIYCVVFFFVLWTLCCQFLWIVHVWLSLRYSLTSIYGKNQYSSVFFFFKFQSNLILWMHMYLL